MGLTLPATHLKLRSRQRERLPFRGTEEPRDRGRGAVRSRRPRRRRPPLHLDQRTNQQLRAHGGEAAGSGERGHSGRGRRLGAKREGGQGVQDRLPRRVGKRPNCTGTTSVAMVLVTRRHLPLGRPFRLVTLRPAPPSPVPYLHHGGSISTSTNQSAPTTPKR